MRISASGATIDEAEQAMRERVASHHATRPATLLPPTRGCIEYGAEGVTLTYDYGEDDDHA